MGKMPSVIKPHSKDRLSRLKRGEEHGHVRLSSRVRLHVHGVRPEKLKCPLARQILGHVNEFASSVITSPRKTFGVLVGKHRPHGFHDGVANVVLRRYHLEFPFLTLCFHADNFRYLLINPH